MMTSLRNMNVLLAEDNPAEAYLTEQAFKELESASSRQLHLVKDGEEALKFLRREGDFADAPRPELVLLDINMPRKNGFDVLKSIRADEALRTLPVLMLTTSSSDNDIETAYREHANCYLTKPTDIDQFFDLVKNIDTFWLRQAKLPFIH